MNKVISIYSVIVLLIGFSSFTKAREDIPYSTSTFIYQEEVGGPYTNDWYLNGDINNLHIFRNGKQGFLKAPVAIDCKLQTLKVTGEGIIWGDNASAERLKNHITKEVTDAAVSKMCEK